jgi:phenylacetate-CoA ligase
VSWPRRLLNTTSLAARVAVERRVPFWPAARIERAQARRVRQMVAHAFRSVPYYRTVLDELGLRPDDFQTAADLARLPIVEREQLQREPQAFLSTAHPNGQWVRLWSGGSTGIPRTVNYDPAALLANAAHGERDRSLITSLIGRPVGYREAVLVPPVSSAYEVQHAVRNCILAPQRVHIARRYLSLLDPPEHVARQIDAFRPDILSGYGSALSLLFAHYWAMGAPFHRPKALTFSSDELSTGTRRRIEEEYGIPVFGAYQAIEALKIGFECGQGRGYHLNVDLYPIRIVDEDGRDVPTGTSGEVIVSNLINRSTVLLNYRLGDVATLATEPCPCGRSLPLLKRLEGRSDDIVTLPSGRVVHPMALLNIPFAEPGVWQYQIVQEAPDRFRVAVVAAPGVDRTALRERIANGLAEVLVDPAAIDVRFVEVLDRTPGGKVRAVIGWRGSAASRDESNDG